MKVVRLENTKNFHVNHILIQADLEGHPIKSLQYLLRPSSRATPCSSSLTDFWDSKLVRIRMTPKGKLFVSKIRRTFMLIIFQSKPILKATRSSLYNISCVLVAERLRVLPARPIFGIAN